MSNPATNGIHLTKDYYNDFIPTDLQWNVSKIDDDFTLYDLFRLVHEANRMIPNISATMGVTKFQEFWDQMQLDREGGCGSDIDYLELSWAMEYGERIEKKTGKPTDQSSHSPAFAHLFDDSVNEWEDHNNGSLPNLMAFGGVGQGCPMKECLEDHDCEADCPKTTGYAIEMTPVNYLAHLPIRVSPIVTFPLPYLASDIKLNRSEFQLTINPTLWCFITSIFWELTFCGNDPKEISASRDEIIDQVNGLKRLLEDEDQEESDGI